MSEGGAGVRRLLVGIDGSEASLHAAERAMQLASALGADLVFVFVLDETVARDLAIAFPEDGETGAQRLEADARGRLEQLAERARQRGLACAVRVERGDPVQVLADAADELAADILVVGRTGMRGVRRVLLGSVARRLAESSRVPVLVIGGPA